MIYRKEIDKISTDNKDEQLAFIMNSIFNELQEKGLEYFVEDEQIRLIAKEMVENNKNTLVIEYDDDFEFDNYMDYDRVMSELMKTANSGFDVRLDPLQIQIIISALKHAKPRKVAKDLKKATQDVLPVPETFTQDAIVLTRLIMENAANQQKLNFLNRYLDLTEQSVDISAI